MTASSWLQTTAMRPIRAKRWPVQLQKALQSLLNALVARENLNWFQQRGTVEYHAVDVRDAAAFGQLIEEIYSRYGHLDGVIHGAGIIEDKLIKDKTSKSFERVFDTKVNGALNILQCLKEDPDFIVFFFASNSIKS